MVPRNNYKLFSLIFTAISPRKHSFHRAVQPFLPPYILSFSFQNLVLAAFFFPAHPSPSVLFFFLKATSLPTLTWLFLFKFLWALLPLVSCLSYTFSSVSSPFFHSLLASSTFLYMFARHICLIHLLPVAPSPYFSFSHFSILRTLGHVWSCLSQLCSVLLP